MKLNDLQVFCDKGAERKARDEERRASKRRTTPSGKRRLDEMYHTPLERSEFYSMAELSRPPVSIHPRQILRVKSGHLNTKLFEVPFSIG